MPQNKGSSASSATRKKHAAKAAKAHGEPVPSGTPPPPPTGRGQKKVKKDRFAPKVKRYVPPPPPPKGLPDPVDLYLAGGSAIDAELVVILRRLMKKDEATVAKGIEGLEAWIKDVIALESTADKEDWEKEQKRDEVAMTMDVWAHHLARLALHPARRIRHQTLTLTALIVLPSDSPTLAACRETIFAPQWLENAEFLGPLACSAFDTDRSVRVLGSKVWQQVPVALDENSEAIWNYAARLIFEETAEEDVRAARRAQAIACEAWLVEQPGDLHLSEDALGLVKSEELWDLLADEQPTMVKRQLYTLLEKVVARPEGLLEEEEVAARVLKYCWSQEEGWPGIIAFLRRYSDVWDEEALQLFLQHLTLGCSSHSSLYPTILLLISTIPASILPPSSDPLLFESFWAAKESRVLASLPNAKAEFISALLECLWYRAGKLSEQPDLVVEWVGRCWQAFLRDRGFGSERIAKCFQGLLCQIVQKDAALFERVWQQMTTDAFALLDSDASLHPLSSALVVFASSTPLHDRSTELSTRLLATAATLIQQAATPPTRLLDFVQDVRKAVEGDAGATETMHALATSLVETEGAHDFLLAQLKSAPKEERDELWSKFFEKEAKVDVLKRLLDARDEGSVPLDLPTAGIDDFVIVLGQAVLAGLGDAPQSSVVRQLVVQPVPFVSADTSRRLLDMALDNLSDLVSDALRGQIAAEPHATAVFGLLEDASRVPDFVPVLAQNGADFLLAARALPALGVATSAEAVWSVVASSAEVLERLALLVLSDIVVSPSELCDVVSSLPNANLAAVAPTQAHLASLDAPTTPPSPLLSIVSPLCPQSGPAPPLQLSVALRRSLLAILEIAARDHSWIKANVWSLRWLLVGSCILSDLVALAQEASDDTSLLASLDGCVAFTLSSLASDLPLDWHNATISALKAGTASEGLQQVLVDLFVARDSYSTRAFSRLLQLAMRNSDAGHAEAERWLAFASNLGGLQGRAVIFGIKDSIVGSPRFERYQNELAATIAGVAPSLASTKGLDLLQLLIATAPAPDSPVIFLPQQRTVFLLRQIQTWISSDDDLADEVMSLLAELFVHLAPIVQDLSGSHWDLIFDIVESNLETAAWEEPETLPAMYHSCSLLLTLTELAVANRDLRSLVQEKSTSLFALVRDLYLTLPSTTNAPLSRIVQTMSTLISQASVDLSTSFSQLFQLLRNHSLPIKLSAYALLSRATSKQIQELVVEAELDVEDKIEIALAPELIALLGEPDSLLFGWLAVFGFFQHASPKIKSAYVDQLRRLELIDSSFVGILHFLGIAERPLLVDVSPFQVDDFQIELLDQLDDSTVPILAAHLYYLALVHIPSLVRGYYESLRSRQTSLALYSLTCKHFSPVLISSELAHLVDPPAELTDNPDFTIKVSKGANEVKAVFIVDEQTMELSIKVPSEFPLVGVEVKEGKRVGVDERQWRAWMLAVKQVITSQNGLVADALTLFKRNVTLHFDGVEACAICYSVISVVDRSLPRKECRTCHNRFHAGCLFKWFSTSHGSSCPLCRSLF